MWYIVLVFMAGMVGCSAEDETPEIVSRPYPVRVSKVSTGDLVDGVPALGTISWERQVKVRSQVGGVIHELTPEEGTKVEGGAVLVRIIAPEMKARLEQIDAELRRANAERDYVCSNHDVDKKLGEAGALESARIDISKKGCTTATEAVKGIEARRSEARAAMAKLTEKAPETGTLLEWYVEPGEFVTPGQPLGVLGAGDTRIVAMVPEVDIKRGVGLGTKVLVQTSNQLLSSEVVFVSALAKGPARVTRVEIGWPQGASTPLAGTSVDITLVLNEAKNAPIVPAEAVYQRDGGFWIRTIQDAKAHEHRVTPVLSSDGKVALPSDGFDAEVVVVSRPAAVPEGAELFIVEAP